MQANHLSRQLDYPVTQIKMQQYQNALQGWLHHQQRIMALTHQGESADECDREHCLG